MKIAFYKATRPGLQGIFNVLVRWWTRGPYSHTELVLEERHGLSLCGSSSFIDGGVRLKWIKLKPGAGICCQSAATLRQRGSGSSGTRGRATTCLAC